MTFDEYTATRPPYQVVEPVSIDRLFRFALVGDHLNPDLRDRFLTQVAEIAAARRQETLHAT